MQTATHHSAEVREGVTGPAFVSGDRETRNATHPSAATLAHWEKKAPPFVSLAAETRTAVDTATAAHFLMRKPQTLRGWAMRDGTGPIRCFRINGRLAWPVAELRRVLGVA